MLLFILLIVGFYLWSKGYRVNVSVPHSGTTGPIVNAPPVSGDYLAMVLRGYKVEMADEPVAGRFASFEARHHCCIQKKFLLENSENHPAIASAIIAYAATIHFNVTAYEIGGVVYAM